MCTSISLGGGRVQSPGARDPARSRADQGLHRHPDLPPGAVVSDYAFQEGPRGLGNGDEPVTTVRLGELFTAPDRPLVIYHFMYGKAQTTPCPMCTMWIDGFNGVAGHLAQNVDFAIAAAADPAALRAHARARGWARLAC